MIIGKEIPKELNVEWFPINKYNFTANRLKDAGIEIIEPAMATMDDMLLVHTPEYLKVLLNQKKERKEIDMINLLGGLDLTPIAITVLRYMVGGTILGMETALKTGWAVNIGGGFHHATADYASGFCHLNDLAIAIRKAKKEHGIKKAMTIDCDVHYGDGTREIFRNDPNVFTFSIHGGFPDGRGNDFLEIGMRTGTNDYQYLEALKESLLYIFREFTPELIIYQGGVDAFKDDQMGCLSLTKKGMRQRDQLVFEAAHSRNIPIVGTFGGGYAVNINDIVDMHTNMCLTAIEINA